MFVKLVVASLCKKFSLSKSLTMKLIATHLAIVSNLNKFDKIKMT